MEEKKYLNDAIRDYESEIKTMIHNNMDLDVVKQQFFSYQYYLRQHQILNMPITDSNYDELYKMFTLYLAKKTDNKRFLR